MLNYLRYALTAVCFAASVGCLALWGRSEACVDTFIGHPVTLSRGTLVASSSCGLASLSIVRLSPLYSLQSEWEHYERPITERDAAQRGESINKHGKFHLGQRAIRFPIWYPALIFAIAGVAAIRFRRQFSIRTALVATTVVAALIGMAVIL